MNTIYDVIVIGAGPAGLAAAIEAKKTGASVLVIERNNEPGGILLQCIHNGFGSVLFKKDLPGPSYAHNFIEEAKSLGIEMLFDTMVLDIDTCRGAHPRAQLRKPKIHFHKLSNKEKAELVEKDPAYGRIVCRCEEITEGEVLEAIHSPVPARTYDGIKRRTWLGTGRCQGAFDYPRVIELLARELKIPVTEVTKKGKGSELVYRRTKDA